MSFESGPVHNPTDEAEIIKMAKSIHGLTDARVMRERLTGIYGHRRAMGWMGGEAIDRERIRAKLFKKEAANV